MPASSAIVRASFEPRVDGLPGGEAFLERVEPLHLRLGALDESFQNSGWAAQSSSSVAISRTRPSMSSGRVSDSSRASAPSMALTTSSSTSFPLRIVYHRNGNPFVAALRRLRVEVAGG